MSILSSPLQLIFIVITWEVSDISSAEIEINPFFLEGCSLFISGCVIQPPLDPTISPSVQYKSPISSCFDESKSESESTTRKWSSWFSKKKKN